jgi:hypothetical protein
MNENNHRGTIAFFFAPLAVPLLLLPWLIYSGLAVVWVIVTLLLSLTVSYIGSATLGLSAYKLLKRHNYTALWIALPVGYAIGAVMWMVFSVFFVVSLGQGISGIHLALSDPASLWGVLWPGGILGTAVGLLFWIIARPDRALS